jgi:hypothetical protein
VCEVAYAAARVATDTTGGHVRVEMYEAASEDPGRPRPARRECGLRAGPWSLLPVTVLAVGLGLAGCGGVESPSVKQDQVTSAADATQASPSRPEATPTRAATDPAATSANGELPNLVGKGLQVAQDAAQEADFYNLTSHDASGRERHQVFDRDWRVCFQTPAPGANDTSKQVDFGVVRLEEDCPSSDARSSDLAPGPASDVPAVMPNLLGRSARAAEETLGSDASVLLRDATGQDRAVLVTSNWQVCEQSPRAGASLAGAPVTLKVVKYGEDC